MASPARSRRNYWRNPAAARAPHPSWRPAARCPRKRPLSAASIDAERQSGGDARVKRKPNHGAVRVQPLIAVRDVRASSRWYRQLLGLEHLGGSDHDDLYDRLLCNGMLILQLHAWDEEDHPNLVDADAGPHGHGVLLWFEVDHFDAVVD